MMFVFGEVAEPLDETSQLVEEITRAQIIETVKASDGLDEEQRMDGCGDCMEKWDGMGWDESIVQSQRPLLMSMYSLQLFNLCIRGPSFSIYPKSHNSTHCNQFPSTQSAPM